jgi:hypothetical protein
MDACIYEWIRDIWMSVHTIDPKVENNTDIPQPRPVPLARCVRCGTIRLLTEADGPSAGEISTR